MASYIASVKNGTRIEEHTIAATSLEQARKEAARHGRVLSVQKARMHVGGRMSIADRTIFFQRLAAMVASRVGMSEALKIIHESFSGSIRIAAGLLSNHISAGASLPEAMKAAGGRYFPEAVTAIIRIGSQGGDIAHSLREAARFEYELEQVKKDSGRGLWNAVFGFIIGVVTLLASTLYVAPEMMKSDLVKIGADGIDIGWVMTLSTTMNWLVGAVAFFMIAFFFMTYVLKPIFPSAIDRFTLKIPVYKDLLLAKNNYISFFGLSVLLMAGLRVEEALRLARDSTPRGELKDDLERARRAVVEGHAKPWPYAMNTLHPTDKAALATAEDRAQIAKTVSELALQYKSIFRNRVETIVPIAQLSAALFLSLAGLVLFGVVILPLLQVTNSVMGSL